MSRLLPKARNAVPSEDMDTATAPRLRSHPPEYPQEEEEWQGPLARSAWGETYGDREAGPSRTGSVISSRSGEERATARGRRGDRGVSHRQQQLANPAGRRRASWFAVGATPSSGGRSGNAPGRDGRSVGEGVRTGRREGEGGTPSIRPAARSIASDRDNADDVLLGKQRARSLPSRSRNPSSSRLRQGGTGRGESFDENFWRSPWRTWGGRWGTGLGSGEKRGSLDGSDSCDFRDGHTDIGGSQRDSLEEDLLGEFLSGKVWLGARRPKTLPFLLVRRHDFLFPARHSLRACHRGKKSCPTQVPDTGTMQGNWCKYRLVLRVVGYP